SIPNSRSVSSERSWTSSSSTAATPGSSGSASRRRSSTPGVSISSRVPAPTSRCPRTVNPTGPPGEVPSSWARRRAAARTATRRGWVTRVSPSERFATSGGTRVVLPVPGGAVTTIAPRRAAASSSARAVATGRPAPMASRSKRCGGEGGRDCGAGIHPSCRAGPTALSVDDVELDLLAVLADAGHRDGPQIDGRGLPEGDLLDRAGTAVAERGAQLCVRAGDALGRDGERLPGALRQVGGGRPADLREVGALPGARLRRGEVLGCRSDGVLLLRHAGGGLSVLGTAPVRGAARVGGSARVGGGGARGRLLGAGPAPGAAGGQQRQGEQRPGEAHGGRADGGGASGHTDPHGRGMSTCDTLADR